MSNSALSTATYRLKWFRKASRECRSEQRFPVPAPQDIDATLSQGCPSACAPRFSAFSGVHNATATTKTEDQETPASETSDSPVLDLLDAAVKRLIKAAKVR